ncbi:MarR family transcriptional regulator [Apilactobacillus apisilvae]|uniref:MarR family transcriptional regulator n=1 Tax=Apilactobacillus apisilvae TaxID=2923364 RepID=A0ABY4PHK3_9LACO|nr:MarR family transcriptional regulator [Apilactobacillus apisilvae]UQS85118.1 MarR family transcriptional regulator [Apilactobacillus apisilvae]
MFSDDNLGIKINIINNLVGNHFQQEIKKLFPELTSSQFAILTYLFDRKDQIVSQDALAAAMHTSHPTMRNIIKRMVAKNLLLIRPLKTDKRKVEVILSKKSKSLILDNKDNINLIINNINKKITNGMDKKDLKQLNFLFSEIINNFS